MINTENKPNQLINEKSPYLLQHAYNPVKWYPWGKEAFEIAQKENKPIFLSIGYSTCHWCHVMERESFEDYEVASLLNQYFVAIKVDREERPDIDHLYMEFCQALTGSGGWPLTIIMTPDKKQPFFAGTYFPKNQHYGRTGLLDILAKVGELWETNETKLRDSAEEIVKAIQEQRRAPALSQTSDVKIATGQETATGLSGNENAFKAWAKETLDKAYRTFERTFDPVYGGFGQAPKFPTPHILSFLLRYAKEHPQSQALDMVSKTLSTMASGGIYDHIGYGFARYSTDQKWLVPHFEKMLYDNALVALAYLESYQASHNSEDKRIAKEIFTYIMRDMQAPEGSFYSAEDADSEGVEGKFYVWTPEEIIQIIGKEDGELFCEVFDITPNGNFEDRTSIPNLLKTDLEKIATKHNLSHASLLQKIQVCRQKLFDYREQRIHPYKDDKILTSWNGLMIAAFAKGAQVLNQSEYFDVAEKAVSFILTNLRQKDGRLLARYREGHAAYPAYLDDYAFLVWGLLELYTACGKPKYLELALELQKDQERLFSDSDKGGYFLTGSDAEELLFRPKESYDGALPSGNSISTLNLLRLSRITGDSTWETLAEKQIHVFKTIISQYPTGYTAFLQALQFALYPSQELILAGPLTSTKLPSMQKIIFSDFNPYSTVLYQEGTLEKSIPWLKDYPFNEEGTTAYLCQNFTCQKPVQNPEDLASLLHP